MQTRLKDDKQISALSESMKNLQLKHGNKTLCLRFNRAECNDRNCKFAHLCAVRLPNGQACGQRRPASQHRFKAPAEKSRARSSLRQQHLTVFRGPLRGCAPGSLCLSAPLPVSGAPAVEAACPNPKQGPRASSQDDAAQPTQHAQQPALPPASSTSITSTLQPRRMLQLRAWLPPSRHCQARQHLRKLFPQSVHALPRAPPRNAHVRKPSLRHQSIKPLNSF